MRGSVWCACFGALGLLGAAGAAVGGPEEGTNVTIITAAQLTYDYLNHNAVFRTNVVVRDPSVRIESDLMTIVFDATNSPKVVTACGNVKIWQQDKKGTCQKAVYQVPIGRLDMSGSPVLSRAQDTLTGKVITFWRNEDRMEGEEIQMVIYNRGGATNGLPRF